MSLTQPHSRFNPIRFACLAIAATTLVSVPQTINAQSVPPVSVSNSGSNLAQATNLGPNQTSINIGGTSIIFPIPEGFTEVTPDMTAVQAEVNRISKLKTERTLHKAFILNADVPDAKAGKAIKFDRYIYVESGNKLRNMTLTMSDFKQIKDGVIKETTIATNKEKLENDINSKVKSNATDVQVSNLRFSPISNEADRVVFMSLVAATQVNADNGETVTTPMAATSGQILVNGKLLSLSVYAKEKELAWTQNSTKLWSQAVLTANPVIETGDTTSAKPASYRVGESVGNGIVGVIAIGIVRLLIKKAKRA